VSDFDDLIDTDGMDAGEARRLHRVHDLLVQAGPPPDLPPELERAPEGRSAEIVQFPLLPKRRWAVAALVAATLAVLAFGGGYLTGHSKSGETFATKHVVAMHGSTDALAILRIADADSVGNWPMELEVTGLPKQSARGAYYVLWLAKNGKPTEICGTFRVHGKTTRVRFSVPYQLAPSDSWVVTAQGRGAVHPGRILLTT
jgi:hypothetical protein